jgi:2-alkenal reductase
VVNIEVIQSVPRGPEGFEFPVTGSGFIIDKEGHIVTNNHVVAHAAQVWVTLYDDTRVPAEVIGTDPDSDLAVLKVSLPPDRLVPVELGDSSQVKVGQKAIAIGNPFGLEGSMTVGIVSAVGRTIPSGTSVFSIPEAIQTDAPINPGNSGGPLLDLAGRVIGVNTQIRSEDRANSGVGFAVPVNIVKQVVPNLIATGQHVWPWLGVRGGTLTPDMAQANGLPVDRGAYIAEVIEGGPSYKAGLRGAMDEIEVNGRPVPIGGDVIIAIDGTPIRNFDELLIYVTRHASVGQTVELTVVRGTEELKIPVTLEARPRLTPR